jgi:hypothetical protein
MEKRNSKNGHKKNMMPDPIVDRLVSDPKSNPDIKVLSGFVGNSSKEGYVRLYINTEMNEFIDILEDDVIERHSTSSETNPLGGSVLWVKKSANLQYTRIESVQVQADFLKGSIVDQNVPSLITDAGAFVFYKKNQGVISIPARITPCFSCPDTLSGPDCRTGSFFCTIVCTFTPDCISTHNPCPGK